MLQEDNPTLKETVGGFKRGGYACDNSTVTVIYGKDIDCVQLPFFLQLVGFTEQAILEPPCSRNACPTNHVTLHRHSTSVLLHATFHPSFRGFKML